MRTKKGMEREQVDFDVADAAFGQDDYALTRAEAAQLVAERRDRLYKSMQTIAIGFVVVSIAVMTGFKINEDFLTQAAASAF